MERLEAVRLTSEATRRVSAGGRGRVHSAFARTVNLELEDPGDAGWLSLHGAGPIPSPFGVACAALAVSPGLTGVPVRLEPGAIVLEGRLRVRLDRAVTVDTGLPSTAPAPSVDLCLRRALPVRPPCPRRGSCPLRQRCSRAARCRPTRSAA